MPNKSQSIELQTSEFGQGEQASVTLAKKSLNELIGLSMKQDEFAAVWLSTGEA